MMSAQLQESASKTSKTRNAEAPEAPATPSPMRNATACSKSPYVLSQKDSAVRWQLFNDEAIQRAKDENKLIFLHIGFSASHYCYLMLQESFTHPSVIGILNEHFIPIFIDREERPDLDHIYMNYIHSLSSVAGHPLNVFTTPDLEPVFGGTYWPGPGSQHIKVDAETGEETHDFLGILKKLRDAWPSQQAYIAQDGRKNVVELRKMVDGTLGRSDGGDVDIDQIEEAYSKIFKDFDHTYGGFIQMPPNAAASLGSKVDVSRLGEVYDYIKKTPKHLTSAKISFLLKAKSFPQEVTDVVGEQLIEAVSRFAVSGCLVKILAGGIHDHIGAGFHRCSTSRDWSVPMFEKMLSDNALMLGVFLDAWQLCLSQTDPAYTAYTDKLRDAALELANYLTSAPILQECGGFATSEAASSPNRRGDRTLQHGAYYLWTKREFDNAIGNEEESRIAATFWGVREHGNVGHDQDPNDEYLNRNVLRVVHTYQELSMLYKTSEDEVAKLIRSAKAKLSAYRQKERVRPAVDTKIVTAYNGMAIASLARTYSTGIESRDKFLDAAKRAATFIKNQLWDDQEKTLYRMYCNGSRAETKVFAEDYAFLIHGILELYEVTKEESWLDWVDELQAVQFRLFYDLTTVPAPANNKMAKSGGFYSTEQDAPHIIIRIKDAMDTAQPSVNARSAANLARAAWFLGMRRQHSDYYRLGVETVHAFEPQMMQYPYLYPGLLTTMVTYKLQAPPQKI